MEELQEIVLKKRSIYKSLYITASEMEDKVNCKFYGKQIRKLNKILKILE